MKTEEILLLLQHIHPHRLSNQLTNTLIKQELMPLSRFVFLEHDMNYCPMF